MGVPLAKMIPDEIIAECWLKTKSARKAAAELGINRGTVHSALNRLGVRKKRHTEKDARICSLRRSGMSLPDIAAEIGCSKGYITRILNMNGLRTRRSKVRSDGMSLHHEGYLYMWIPSDDLYSSMRSKKGLVPFHRLVMARAIGRPLTRSETVHHINSDKTDNRIENLQLLQGRHGKGWAMCCLDCGSHRIGHAPLTTATIAES